MPATVPLSCFSCCVHPRGLAENVSPPPSSAAVLGDFCRCASGQLCFSVCCQGLD